MLELWEMQNTLLLPLLSGPLCRGEKHPQQVYWRILNNLMVRFQWCWSFGECKVTLHCNYSLVHSGQERLPDRVQSMGQIEIDCVLMQNWIFWNRTVFEIETVLRVNRITWNKTVLTFTCVWTKTILILNWIVWIRTVWLNWIASSRNVFDN